MISFEWDGDITHQVSNVQISNPQFNITCSTEPTLYYTRDALIEYNTNEGGIESIKFDYIGDDLADKVIGDSKFASDIKNVCNEKIKELTASK